MHERSQDREDGDTSKDLFGRFVFIGGPGSGKSTIGQFLAQIHRAVLLDRRPAYRLEDRVKKLIREIKLRCEQENAAWPGTPRYPFRVELNAFAKAMAKSDVKTLSEYLRLVVSRDTSLSHEDLREWLRVFPSLLILDGLDEVPPSSNRREVVNAIQAFMSEARDLEADLMIVATSRPDGYDGEFDGEHVLQLYLTPLSKGRALECARRYLTAKSLSESRLTDAMSILDSAVDNPLIARLMRSPLQVTFMVTVVASSGKPSESRWQLFSDYYRTIYERELHKAVPPFDRVLNSRRQDIDALHHRVGFVLQRRAELSGGTQADLSIAEFEQIVEACLEENGLPSGELAHQKRMILGAASSRLVFLTSKTPGQLSFDVRSLQEYMAAACLTNADSAEVMNRLDAIVHSGYWRNTLLFAVGRFFVEPQMRTHRDKIRILCEDLNRKDPERAKVLLGSRLALDMLESGTVGNVPLVTRSLTRCALELLSIPHPECSNDLIRLASVYDVLVETEFRSEVSLRIGQRNLTSALSAWLLTLYLERQGVAWAEEVLRLHWPAERMDEITVLRTWLELQVVPSDCGEQFELTKRDIDRLARVVRCIPVEGTLELLGRAAYQLGLNGHWLQGLEGLSDVSADRPLELRVGTIVTGLSIRMCFLPREGSPYMRALAHLAATHLQDAERLAIDKLLNFMRQPCLETLFAMLEHVARPETPTHWESLMETAAPWPLACLRGRSPIGSSWTTSDVQHSLFKNARGWYAMEQEWSECGITLDQLCEPLFPNGPSLCAAVRGLDRDGAGDGAVEVIVRAMLDKLTSLTDPQSRDGLVWMIEYYTSGTSSLHLLEPAWFRDQVLPAQALWWSSQWIVDFSKITESKQQWLAACNAFGQHPSLKFDKYPWRLKAAPVDLFLETFLADPSQTGLLRLAAFWCAAGRVSKVRAPPPSYQLRDIKDQIALLVLRMADPSLTMNDAEQISEWFRSYSHQLTEDEWDLFLYVIERHVKAAVPVLRVVLNSIIDLVPADNWGLRGAAEHTNSKFLQLGSSYFSMLTLQRFGLPCES